MWSVVHDEQAEPQVTTVPSCGRSYAPVAPASRDDEHLRLTALHLSRLTGIGIGSARSAVRAPGRVTRLTSSNRPVTP
jgi:hypothetical protein